MNLRIVSSPHEEFSLSSTVKGQRIFLDSRVLASILHIPHTGIYIFQYKKWPKVEGFTPITSCQFSGTKLKKEDTYNKSTLNRMGWKKQDGNWTYCPKSDQGQKIEREEHEEIPPWEAQEAPPFQVQGSSSTRDYDRMMEFMSARFDALNTRFDSMEASIEGKFEQVNSRLDNLENDHMTIRSDFETIEDSIYYDLHVTKRRLKRLERKLVASKTIDTCEDTSGDESSHDYDPPPARFLIAMCCCFSL
ncbi:hypothetical protein CFOL_v3_22065 [Cephalotus follicularis]|uniref:Uncharacterized protein n=1 Tax=Cephalotus follicularis TaxID=3775 RepID=A0A1Q3CED5_CEPFO|nr:hypothetical protein CFOL_v3_22065 [Cephalotus follicularis]